MLNLELDGAVYGVRFHYEEWTKKDPDNPKCNPQPLKTRAQIFNAEGHILSTGIAVRNTKDQHCKKTGRDLAFGRAMHNLVPRADIGRRRDFWEEYKFALQNYDGRKTLRNLLAMGRDDGVRQTEIEA